MASLTIRNIDQKLKSQLRMRAARHARSMEAEARTILRDALRDSPSSGEFVSAGGLASAIAKRLQAAGGGVDLDIPPRDPPAFDEPER